jgi:hypothetical protein
MEWLSTYGNIAAAILMLLAGLVSTLLLGWLGYHRLRWQFNRLVKDMGVLERCIEENREMIAHLKDTRPSHDDLTNAVNRVEHSVNDLRGMMNLQVDKLCERMDAIYSLLASNPYLNRRN